MSQTETKRKPGRPSARQQNEAPEQTPMPPAPAVNEPGTRASQREPWTMLEAPKAGVACIQCGGATERNDSLFKALGLSVVRCMKCRIVSIDGDTMHYDLVSAGTGQLYRRALAYYETKHPTMPIPKTDDRLSDILASGLGDPRWND